jgi:hypothetical protein
MRRRPKTPEELRSDLNIFETAWKREQARVMRNVFERMVATGNGRIPARYQMKLPRFTRTVLEPSGNAGARTVRRPPDRSRPSTQRRTLKKTPQQREENRRARAAELLELRRSLENAVDRTEAFRDERPLPPRYEMALPESMDATAIAEVRSFEDAARVAHERLLQRLRKL